MLMLCLSSAEVSYRLLQKLVSLCLKYWCMKLKQGPEIPRNPNDDQRKTIRNVLSFIEKEPRSRTRYSSYQAFFMQIGKENALASLIRQMNACTGLKILGLLLTLRRIGLSSASCLHPIHLHGSSISSRMQALAISSTTRASRKVRGLVASRRCYAVMPPSA
jgi:hypothetical protein